MWAKLYGHIVHAYSSKCAQPLSPFQIEGIGLILAYRYLYTYIAPQRLREALFAVTWYTFIFHVDAQEYALFNKNPEINNTKLIFFRIVNKWFGGFSILGSDQGPW